MARPVKVGLDYYPADTNRRNDFKIMDLLDEYGPLGYTIYDFCLQYIYENGYYLKIPIKQLRLSIIKDIGSKWIKNKDLVGQVIDYCAEIGLFDKDLLQQNVITSVGIQRRYDSVTVRNKVKKSEFWLLEKENSQEACTSAPKTEVSATETGVSATITSVSATEMRQRKEKERKEKESKRESSGSRNSGEDFSHTLSHYYGRFKNVLLSDDEITELEQLYPQTYKAKIERLSSYLKTSNKEYHSHFAKLLEWLDEDREQDMNKSKTDASKSFDIKDLERFNYENKI